MKRSLSALALMGSLGTLICCVLPAVFVALGMGAAFAGLLTNVPQLIWFSQHKGLVFGGAALAIAAAAIAHWRARHAPCPTDPALAQACGQLKGWAWWALLSSVALFLVGGFFAFVAPRIFG